MFELIVGLVIGMGITDDKWHSYCIKNNTEYNKTKGYPYLHKSVHDRGTGEVVEFCREYKEK